MSNRDLIEKPGRPARSPRLFTLFRWYAKRYVSRHFHALRVSKSGPLPALARRPVVVVVNHPSWWDPLIGLILTEMMPAWRIHYAPIDMKGLAQYRFLERLGFFGIELGTTRGHRKFLRTGLAILDSPESMLWITGQGEFVDPRERPVVLKEGVGHLAYRLSGAIFLPMGVEYPFWNDRCPEVLVRFGPQILVESGRDRSPTEWKRAFEQALQDTQDQLAMEARGRDPAGFDAVLGGTAGVGGVYDIWRRLRSALGGASFHPEHSIRPAAGEPVGNKTDLARPDRDRGLNA